MCPEKKAYVVTYKKDRSGTDSQCGMGFSQHKKIYIVHKWSTTCAFKGPTPSNML